MDFTVCLKSVDLELQNNFRELKRYTYFLYQSYTRLHNKNCSSVFFDFYKKSFNVNSCSKFLKFGHTESGIVKLHNANFCRDRLCPMCACRRSKKIYGQVYSCVDYMKNDYRFIVLTLTVRNVDASSLSDTVTHLNRSFSNLVRNYYRFKRICKGYLKCLEITYNCIRDDFHPHLHILIAVDKDYFKSDYYLHQSDFLSMWQMAAKDSSISQVDVRKIYYNPNRSDLNDISSAVAEVAKYSVKPSDYIFPYNNFLTDKVVYTFSTVLHKRRLLSFGGVFNSVRKLLFSNDDLFHTDNKEKDDFVSFSSYVWFHGSYHLYAVELPDQLVFRCSDDDFVDLQTGEVLLE